MCNVTKAACHYIFQTSIYNNNEKNPNFLYEIRTSIRFSLAEKKLANCPSLYNGSFFVCALTAMQKPFINKTNYLHTLTFVPFFRSDKPSSSCVCVYLLWLHADFISFMDFAIGNERKTKAFPSPVRFRFGWSHFLPNFMCCFACQTKSITRKLFNSLLLLYFCFFFLFFSPSLAPSLNYLWHGCVAGIVTQCFFLSFAGVYASIDLASGTVSNKYIIHFVTIKLNACLKPCCY